MFGIGLIGLGRHGSRYARHIVEDLRQQVLVRQRAQAEHVEEYDGTTAVVRSEHLAAEEIEFLRWRSERWMKLRHLPTKGLQAR